MSEIGAIDLDDDLIARSITGFAQPVIEPPKPQYANLGYASTIAPAAPKFSPVLVPPKNNIMIRVLRAQQEAERLAEERTRNFEVDSAKALDEINKLNDAKEAAFRQELELAKNRDTWSTLSIVAQYIGSVSAVMFGMSIGGVAGILLALGGVAGGTVRVLNDTNLLQPIIAWYTKSEELQKSIKENIDMGSMYLQLGLGLAGGAAAWHAGAFAAMEAANTLAYMEHFSSTLNTASSVMNGASQVGKTYYEYHMADWNSRQRMAELGIFEQRQELTHQTKEIGEMFDSKESLEQQVKKMIKKQEVQLD